MSRPGASTATLCENGMRVCSVRLLVGLAFALGLGAQELEPRAYSVSPVGTNVVLFAYGHSMGDLSFDPTLPVEDPTASLNVGSAGYFRSIDIFGRSGNIAVAVPYIWGTAQGRLAGDFQEIRRSGLPDPRIRFAVNLRGAPAMDLGEFASYRQKTNIGASLVVLAPLGQYDANKLINLGSNRWVVKPEVGVSHAIGRWVLDAYGGVWLFTANDSFQGAKRTQKPLWTTQAHISYNLRPRLWLAFDANFYAGGRTTLDGTRRLDRQQNSRLGGTVSIPITPRQSLKFAYSFGAFVTFGGDFQSVAVAYQYLWGKGM